MTKRSQWCEFDKDTRKYINKRDNNKCLICNNKGALQIAHIFLSRAHGGRGVKENGVLLCIKHHQILDNYIGNQESEKDRIQHYCEDYLIEKENLKERFKNKKELIDYLKFDKESYLKEIQNKVKNKAIEQHKEEIKPIYQIDTKKCKNCLYLVKNKRSNSTIPSYWCKIKRQITNKNNETCKNFKERRND